MNLEGGGKPYNRSKSQQMLLIWILNRKLNLTVTFQEKTLPSWRKSPSLCIVWFIVTISIIYIIIYIASALICYAVVSDHIFIHIYWRALSRKRLKSQKFASSNVTVAILMNSSETSFIFCKLIWIHELLNGILFEKFILSPTHHQLN